MDDSWKGRITVDNNQMGGVPCIRGLRIPVTTVIRMLADGMVSEEILEALPDLERDDIVAALQYAAFQLKPPSDDGGAGMLASRK